METPAQNNIKALYTHHPTITLCSHIMASNNFLKRSSTEEAPVFAKKSVVGKTDFAQQSDDVPFYKKSGFYDHKDTHKLRNLKVRKFVDEDGGYSVHWSKDNVNRRGTSSYGNSHQQINANALPQFLSVLKALFTEINTVTYKQNLPRFEDNQYAQITDRNDPDFWHSSIVETVQHSELLIRPFKDKKGQWTVRILQPVFSADNPEWSGILCNFNIKDLRDFLIAIELIEKEFDELEEERMRTFAVSVNQ